jgi:hypothetical protein
MDMTGANGVADKLLDRRRPDRIRYRMVELLRERLYALAQGYDAQDDVDELAHDPAMRLAVWDRPGERVQQERLASQPTQSRLLAALGNYKPNIETLRETLADWPARHLRATGNDHAARRITIDIDSFPIQAYGQQAGAKYNGYYREEVFHPLVASFTVGGDYDGFQNGLRLGQGFVHAVLRAGNVHTASGAKRFFLETARKAKQLGYVAEFRFDAGFAEGAILDLLTDQNIHFLARLKANARLQEFTLLLALLAFNLANMLRCELEHGGGACWDLGRFQKSVLKAGGRIVKKARRVIVDLAQAVVPLWERLLARLGRWRLSNRFPAPRCPIDRPFMPPPRHAFLMRVIRE